METGMRRQEAAAMERGDDATGAAGRRDAGPTDALPQGGHAAEAADGDVRRGAPRAPSAASPASGGPEPHEELEAACRGLSQATLDLGWAAYLLGSRPLPGNLRPDPTCVRELTGAALDLLLAARDVGLLLDMDGALPLLPEFDSWAALARIDGPDVEVIDALEIFMSLAGHAALARRQGHTATRAARTASIAEGGRR